MHKKILFISCMVLYCISLRAMDPKQGETLIVKNGITKNGIKKSPTLQKIPKTSPRTNTIQSEYTLDSITNTKPATVSPRTWRNNELNNKKRKK